MNLLRVGLRRILAMAALVLLVGSGRGFGGDCSTDGATLCTSDTCGSTTWTLFAGQTIEVGTVTVCNDLDNIYVNYQIDTTKQPDATFGTLHLWIGDDLLNLPRAGQDKDDDGANDGAPIPGQFPYQADTNGATCWNFTVPFVDLGITNVQDACKKLLYVVTHAEVNNVVDENGDTSNETAFGGDQTGDGNRWWFYGIYTVCCDFGPPPVPFCQTAYGYGTHVWTTDKKSNPDKLSSLSLTKNRWGWAINMSEPGTYEATIWAGAGLNNTSNGTDVGSLKVVWTANDNGPDTVTVTYTLKDGYGYCLKETHVYVGDDAPDTIAPGQYGITAYQFDGESGYETTAEVEDTGGGIWIVAHAVVCNDCQ